MFEQVMSKATRNAAAGFFVVGVFSLGCSYGDAQYTRSHQAQVESGDRGETIDQNQVADNYRLAGKLAIAGLAELGICYTVLQAGKRATLVLHHRNINREIDSVSAELRQEAESRQDEAASL